MPSLKPCPYCRCYIATSEARCPLCDRVQRSTTAWPAFVLVLGLTGLGACIDRDPDEPKDSIGNSDGPGPDSMGNDAMGNDSVDDDSDSWGEGATYAGPDAWTTTEGDTFDGGTTTGGEQGTDSATSTGTGTDTDTSSDSSGTGGR